MEQAAKPQISIYFKSNDKACFKILKKFNHVFKAPLIN
jgi:hypothetical protein